MSTGYLWRALVIPLVVATVICVAASLVLTDVPLWQGFLINLATTLVGILLTVLYVDFVLSQRERRQWAKAQSRVNQRIETLAIASVSQFRTAFGIGADVLDFLATSSSDPRVRYAEGIRLGETIVIARIETAVSRFTQQDWSSLVRQLRITWDAIDRVLQIHASRLGPELISVLLDLQTHTSNIIDIQFTFPDVLGVDDSDLKPLTTGESAVPLKLRLERQAIRNIETVLVDAVSLLRVLDANGSIGGTSAQSIR